MVDNNCLWFPTGYNSSGLFTCRRCNEQSLHKLRDGKYMPVDYDDGHAWLFVCPNCKADIEVTSKLKRTKK